MFTISAFSFDLQGELFAKDENRFADCFFMQIIPYSLHTRSTVTWFGFQHTKAYHTKIIHYCCILHVNELLCRNDVTTKVVVAA